MAADLIKGIGMQIPKGEYIAENTIKVEVNRDVLSFGCTKKYLFVFGEIKYPIESSVSEGGEWRVFFRTKSGVMNVLLRSV